MAHGPTIVMLELMFCFDSATTEVMSFKSADDKVVKVQCREWFELVANSCWVRRNSVGLCLGRCHPSSNTNSENAGTISQKEDLKCPIDPRTGRENGS
jgi:hypothetical protein